MLVMSAQKVVPLVFGLKTSFKILLILIMILGLAFLSSIPSGLMKADAEAWSQLMENGWEQSIYSSRIQVLISGKCQF